MMILTALVESVRKLVRPITLFALVGAIIYIAIFDSSNKEGLAVLLALTGPMMAWWFKERSDEKVARS